MTLILGHISSLRYLGHCSLFIHHPSYLKFFPRNISFPRTSTDGKLEEIASKIGRTIARLHDGGLIHGDLTTSNMLLDDKTGQLVSFQHLSSDEANSKYVIFSGRCDKTVDGPGAPPLVMMIICHGCWAGADRFRAGFYINSARG